MLYATNRQCINTVYYYCGHLSNPAPDTLLCPFGVRIREVQLYLANGDDDKLHARHHMISVIHMPDCKSAAALVRLCIISCPPISLKNPHKHQY